MRGRAEQLEVASDSNAGEQSAKITKIFQYIHAWKYSILETALMKYYGTKPPWQMLAQKARFSVSVDFQDMYKVPVFIGQNIYMLVKLSIFPSQPELGYN